MATKLRKTKRTKLAENNSDDDSDSESSGTKKSSRTNKQKNKYYKTINTLCDDESSSDKESENFYKSRISLVSKTSSAKASHEIDIDSSNSSNSDSDSSKKRMSKQNKKITTKRKRKNKSSESGSDSALENIKNSNKTTKSSKTKLNTSKCNNKTSNEISLDNSDSSSSKEFQEPKLKRKKTLQESFFKYNFNDYSNVTTPSRANEKNITVESAHEISFKHYVIQEIKKFQKVNSQLHDELECCNDYLLKKKIGSIEDAKFFIHKILKLYEDTFKKFRGNRQEFIKIYETWMNELTNKSTNEIERKKDFSLSSEESDNIFEQSLAKKIPVNKLTENDKPDGKVAVRKNNNKSNTNESAASNISIDSKLAKIQAIVVEDSLVVQESNKSDESVQNMDLLLSSEDSDKPTLKEKTKSKHKLNSTLVSDKEQSVLSTKSSEESENDSVMQGSSCDSDLIFSSEESKAKRKSKNGKKKAKIDIKKNAEKPAATQSSDSEDLFDTSTGEVANTPEQRKSIPVTRMSVENEDEAISEVLKITEEEEQLSVSAPAPAAELDKSSKVIDPKEREALLKLLNNDDDSDGNANSESEEDADKVAEVSATATSSKESAAAAVREKRKIFTKQTKKRSSVCSDSSSSDDGEEVRSTRRGHNKSADGAAVLRTATLPQRKDALELRNNQYYLDDEKLRRKCRVELERLPKSELAKHAKALEKSKKYVERKKILSLANLDNLESKKKSKKNSKAGEPSEFDADNVKQSPTKTNSKQDEKSSVADFLGEKSQTDSNESSNEKDDHENQSALTTGDESFNPSFISDVERKAKEALLRSTSSSSDELVESEMDVDDDSMKQMADRAKDKKNKKASPPGDDSDEGKTDQKKDKSSWKNDKLLTFKFDGSDTEEEKFNKSQEKKKAKQSETENDKSQESPSPYKRAKSTRKTRKTRRILDSDSDVKSVSEDQNENSSDEESDQEDKKNDKKKKRQHHASQSSDPDSSSSGKKQKAKRRRIKKVASDSDSDDKDSPGKGRKNIRKVLKDKYVTDDTKKAAQDEEERLKRIAERQKLFNEMYEMRLAGEEKVEKLVLDIDEETKEELVVVDEELAKRLKPHQARGIKFMWDACFESIEQIEKSEGSGCIIAHCMGLGKTFQVVTLAHTLLSHEKTGVKTVMIVCPLSTVLNWVNEFNIWLKHVNNRDDIEIHEMTKLKKNVERKHKLENWQKYGGVLIIGYEMFRNLTSTGKRMRKNMQESITKSLVDPGADLVVCDEGHLLKNEDSALSKAMKLVKTMRRIVLTGTPLQNNLKEYHCMVQFVKPNLLGTKKEFLNRFVNPITNGQFDDSTPYDVKLMKKRAHVLHKMLEGSVQRFDYSVLTPFLPPKQEYVIFVRLTEVQKKLYQHYLDNFARRLGGRNVTLFADFQALQRIWTHPYVLRLNAEKVEKANEKKRLEASDSEGSLKDFIDDDTTSISEASSNSSKASDSDVECLDSDSEKAGAVKKRGTRANPIAEEPTEPVEETVEEAAWWSEFVDDEQFNDLRISTKLMLLFAILKESESIGDKVLVFSQSLYSLTLIEHFLNLMDEQSQKDVDAEHLNGHIGSWALGVDYFRLDGSTSAENRSIWSKIFNNPKNTRARLFLISTRAGGLGINLIGANRVIIFDASWNPSHDVQSIFRIYRFGQKKPCYVYRFLAAGTMEEKIYNRQVTKLSLACRVVDEQQIERHYSNTDLAELYQFDTCEDQSETLSLPKDRLLAEIFSKYKDFIVKCHEHDSLLENKEEEELDEEERKQAWAEYEEEKKGIRQQGYNTMGNNYAFNQMLMNMNVMPEFQGVKALLQKDYPDVPPEHLDVLARQAMFDMYQQIDQHAALNSLNNFRNPLMPSQNVMANPTIQGEIFRQQNLMMNQPQPNYYGVNQTPAYSGRGRPPKFTSVNNQIVTNPMYMGNAQGMQSLQSVPNDNEVQLLNELPVSSSNKQTASNANN